MNEYYSDLLKDTDKLLLALRALEEGHNFSTIKYKLNKEAGKIADLITSCRRSIQFLKDDDGFASMHAVLEEYAELLKSYHSDVSVTGGLCSSDKYRIKRKTLNALIAGITEYREKIIAAAPAASPCIVYIKLTICPRAVLKCFGGALSILPLTPLKPSVSKSFKSQPTQ